MIFEKIVTSKTAVENPSVIEEHLEFSNCEREVQRVGFKNSETKGRVTPATRSSVLQFL